MPYLGEPNVPDNIRAARPDVLWVGWFEQFHQWVNKASTWLDQDSVCVDAQGRLCKIGRDFMRARDEGAFPVYFGWPEAAVTPRFRVVR